MKFFQLMVPASVPLMIFQFLPQRPTWCTMQSKLEWQLLEWAILIWVAFVNIDDDRLSCIVTPSAYPSAPCTRAAGSARGLPPSAASSSLSSTRRTSARLPVKYSTRRTYARWCRQPIHDNNNCSKRAMHSLLKDDKQKS